ncbi:MAG TPA: hypothetical protein VF990_13355 [Candidatus Dormibacteraeota bacterium]
MSSKPPPWLDPKPAKVGTVVRGFLALGAVFVGAFVLVRGNANAGFFLVLAVVCVGFAFVSLFAKGLQRFGGSILVRTGRSERELLIGGLLLTALLTPWSTAIPPVQWPQRFGWQSSVAIVVVLALVIVQVHRLRPYRMPAIVIAGIGLMAWIAWVSWQLLTPTFRNTGFPFLPIDLLGEGWFIALLAFVITVDGMAVEAANDDDRPPRPGVVWPFAAVPGMGLVRLYYAARGRFWLVVAGFTVLLWKATSVGWAEFQDYGSRGSLPPPRPRGADLVPLGLLLVIWLASLWDTRAKLQLERREAALLSPTESRDPTAG